MMLLKGASSGIGLETARVLALRGVHVVMAVRNVTAGEVAKETILKDIPAANINIMELDLSSMASVRSFASEYISSGLPLNLLINNAGIMATPFALSHDNIELQFATNHLGPFLLTNLLLETLKKTALERNVESRIVNVASLGHRFALNSSFDYDEINDKSRYNKLFAYFMTKLTNILHSNELARQLKEEGVKVMANSLHPGIIVTNLGRHNHISNAVARIGSFLLKNIQQGAATTCYVALHPQLKGVSGLYFSDCNVANTSDKAGDIKLAKELWDLSTSLTK